jgi:NADPH-dependent 7-cyano-7-deazaguanine reductase QueF-like protein
MFPFDTLFLNVGQQVQKARQRLMIHLQAFSIINHLSIKIYTSSFNKKKNIPTFRHTKKKDLAFHFFPFVIVEVLQIALPISLIIQLLSHDQSPHQSPVV